MTRAPASRRRRLWLCLGIAALLAAIALASWLTQDSWAALMRRVAALDPIWAVPVLIALMVAHNIVPIPAEMIALAAGAILGPELGTATVWVGAMLGAVLAFWMSRRWGRGLVQRCLPQRHRHRLDILSGRQSWTALLLVRLIPLFSFNLINYAAGLTAVPWRTFLWTTALGILPVLILTVMAGAHLAAAGSKLMF